MSEKSIIMKKQDNVATALNDIQENEEIEIKTENEKNKIIINDNIPFGHKFAISTIAKGENVIKYGESIGEASQRIEKGDYVHVHNLNSKRGRGDLNKGGGD